MKYKFSHNAYSTGDPGWVVYDARGTVRVFATEYLAAQYVRRCGV